jgi:hypothetical protein
MKWKFQPKFFFPILCCNQISDHPQEDLATIEPNVKIHHIKTLDLFQHKALYFIQTKQWSNVEMKKY